MGPEGELPPRSYAVHVLAPLRNAFGPSDACAFISRCARINFIEDTYNNCPSFTLSIFPTYRYGQDYLNNRNLRETFYEGLAKYTEMLK